MSSLALCEEHSLNILDCVAHNLRQTYKRWDDWAAIQRLNLIEKYIQNHIAALCDLDFSPASHA